MRDGPEITGRGWVGRGSKLWWNCVSWVCCCCEIERLDWESRKRKGALQVETIGGFCVEVFINGGSEMAFPILDRRDQFCRASPPFVRNDCVGGPGDVLVVVPSKFSMECGSSTFLLGLPREPITKHQNLFFFFF